MEVAEVRKKRTELRKSIRKLISDFESETGMEVKSLNICKQMGNSSQSIVDLSIDVELPGWW